MSKRKYDFAGWVTKNDVLCSDGVTIKHDAFRENDGQKVPLVWNHNYDTPNNVLGHVILENRDIGVYGYGYFNDTSEGQNAKIMVKHGDLSSMSIGARRLKRQSTNVVKGSIYEVSLVMAGANPGAMIEEVVQHGEDGDERAIINTGKLIHSYDDVIDDLDEGLKHKVTDDTTIMEVIDTMTDVQKEAVYALLGMLAHSDTSSDDDQEQEEEEKKDDEQEQEEEKKDGEEEKKDADQEQEDDKKDGEEEKKDEDKIDDEKGDKNDMKHNVFNPNGNLNNEDAATLKHAANEVLKLAVRDKVSSLRDMLQANEDVLKHGINSIEMLFPDAYNTTNGNVPIIYKDPNTAYQKILDRIHKSPFSRVKTLVADLTEEEARAKGYIKGNFKKEEFFSLIKRVTTPTTVYKKQKIDRDDIIDITDFDVVAFMNVEMQLMLKEEVARAALVGDGRDFSSEEKINESNIRPIISDHDFFTIKKSFSNVSGFIEAVIKAMAEYRGSGMPSMYIDPMLLADIKLLKDSTGRFLFGDIPSNDAIATRLGMDEMVPTTFMSGQGALIVNLRDYSLGATKGGQITNFDQFDIDYNQHKYLIETRLSGALTLPKSAISLKLTTAGTGANDEDGGMTYGIRMADKKEIATLQITAPVGGSGGGPVSVTLNGATTSVTVANSDTAAAVAGKIRAATFPGWTVTGSGDTAIFTSNTTGNKTDASYSPGSTGATGTMSTTQQGKA